MLYHAVVWIDHREAHVESFTRDASETSYVKALGNPRKIHHRGGSVEGGKAPVNLQFFALVGDALNGAQEALNMRAAVSGQRIECSSNRDPVTFNPS